MKSSLLCIKSFNCLILVICFLLLCTRIQLNVANKVIFSWGQSQSCPLTADVMSFPRCCFCLVPVNIQLLIHDFHLKPFPQNVFVKKPCRLAIHIDILSICHLRKTVTLEHWHLSPKPQLISWKHHRHINEAQNA